MGEGSRAVIPPRFHRTSIKQQLDKSVQVLARRAGRKPRPERGLSEESDGTNYRSGQVREPWSVNGETSWWSKTRQWRKLRDGKNNNKSHSVVQRNSTSRLLMEAQKANTMRRFHSSLAQSSLICFQVKLVNVYRNTRRRCLVIDTEAATISRSNPYKNTLQMDGIVSAVQQSNRGVAMVDSDRKVSQSPVRRKTMIGYETDFDLRKSIKVTRNIRIILSDRNPRKLRVYTHDRVRPLEIIFQSATAREQFSTIVNEIVSSLPMIEESGSSSFASDLAVTEESFSLLPRRNDGTKVSKSKHGASYYNTHHVDEGKDGNGDGDSEEGGEKVEGEEEEEEEEYKDGESFKVPKSFVSSQSTSANHAGLKIFTTTFNTARQTPPEVSVMKHSLYSEKLKWPAGRRAFKEISRNSVTGREPLVLDPLKQSPNISSGSSVVTDHSEEISAAPSVMALADLYEWIPPGEFDVYFVALQECKSKHFAEWQQLVLSLANRRFEDFDSPLEYKVLSTVSMWGIHGILVVRNTLLSKFSRVYSDTRACGLGGMMGNKGAVGISVTYGENPWSRACTTFAFVNSHLAARAERLFQRQQSYIEICHTLLGKKKRKKQGVFQGVQLLHAHDHVFWAGDLNYRNDLGSHGTGEEFDHVIERVNQCKLSELAPHDQLSQERAKHNVFVGFREGPLQFAPTYRLAYGQSCSYNNKRNQNPSWTDRVLYRSLPGLDEHIEQTEYYSAESMLFSDHRPVCAAFNVALSTANNTTSLLGAEPAALPDDFEDEDDIPVAPKRKVLMCAEHDDESKVYCFKLCAVQFECKFIDEKLEAALEALESKEELELPGFSTKESESSDEPLTDSDLDDLEEDINIGKQSGARKKLSLRQSSAPPLNTETASRFEKKHSYRRPAHSTDLADLFHANVATSFKPKQRKPRPKTLTKRDKEGTYAGHGFACGPGSLDQKGDAYCAEGSSEFERYICRANSGLNNSTSKLWLTFRANFLEKKSKTPLVSAASRGQLGTSTYFRYQWEPHMLPVFTPLIQDFGYLLERQVLVTIHRSTPRLSGAFGNAGTVVGHAHIPLKDILSARKSWFAVPVLLNGLPAGVLRGELRHTSTKDHKQRNQGGVDVSSATAQESQSKTYVSSLELSPDNGSEAPDMETMNSKQAAALQKSPGGTFPRKLQRLSSVASFEYDDEEEEEDDFDDEDENFNLDEVSDDDSSDSDF